MLFISTAICRWHRYRLNSCVIRWLLLDISLNTFLLLTCFACLLLLMQSAFYVKTWQICTHLTVWSFFLFSKMRVCKLLLLIHVPDVYLWYVFTFSYSFWLYFPSPNLPMTFDILPLKNARFIVGIRLIVEGSRHCSLLVRLPQFYHIVHLF